VAMSFKARLFRMTVHGVCTALALWRGQPAVTAGEHCLDRKREVEAARLRSRMDFLALVALPASDGALALFLVAANALVVIGVGQVGALSLNLDLVAVGARGALG